MLAQVQHRFTVEDYYRMAAAGVLKPDARVELLDGRIIDMSPIGPFHGGVTKRLIRFFSSRAQGRWIVAAQDPLRLGEFSEPQPDLMLLRPSEDDYTSRHPEPEDVFLLIEVADSSLPFDREEKVPAYSQGGVFEVWLLNLPDKTLEIFRQPQFSGYAFTQTLGPGAVATPLAFPDLHLDVAELLKLTK